MRERERALRSKGAHDQLERQFLHGATAKQIVDTHVHSFKKNVRDCYDLFGDRKDGGYLTLVIAHSMRDNFPESWAARYFREVLQWESEVGYIIAHETHRKRFLHSPWTCRDFFLKYPDIYDKIKLCADFSHFLCVAEVDTNDPVLNTLMDFIIPKVVHTQCRVGYDHGPQVADPRVPEWLSYMQGHEVWWDKIWLSQKAQGKEYVTMIAEHGPPTYQHSMPGTKEPLAQIWDVNHWIQLRRQERFQKLFPHDETSKLVVSESQGFEPRTFCDG